MSKRKYYWGGHVSRTWFLLEPAQAALQGLTTGSQTPRHDEVIPLRGSGRAQTKKDHVWSIQLGEYLLTEINPPMFPENIRVYP